MPATAPNVATFQIKIDGSPLPVAVMDNLFYVEVDSSLHMPAAARVEFHDAELTHVDNASLFKIGADLVISAAGNPELGQAQMEQIFSGVIAAIEPVFTAEEHYSRLVIRAYDRLYLLHRGTQSKSFQNQKDSDIVRAVVNESGSGLSAQVTDTSIVHPHVYRDDCSDYEFIKMLAQRNGFVIVCEGGVLKVKKPSELGRGEVELEFGVGLREFRPALTLVGQVNEVKVEGWDRTNKVKVTGRSASATFSETQTSLQRGYALMNAAHGSKTLHFSKATPTQAEADALAAAALNTVAASDLLAEGVAYGNPRLKAGTKLKVKKVGSRFSGTYFVTRVRHVLDNDSAFDTEFWVGGMSSGTLASLVSPATPAAPVPARPLLGLYPALVTNNKDPNSQGRVRVKFPQITDTDESFWAPVVSVGAGNQRGLWVLPEVNDEVLVGFLHGDINFPVVLGGMWNGQDAPPDTTPTGSTVDVRTFKTRSGHILRFTDKSGEEKIELIDKTGNNKVVIDSKQNSISILAAKNISIESKGGDVSLKGVNVKFEGTAAVEAEGKTKIALKGGMAELSATGQTKVSGATVMIN